jgi:Recombination endonuclease VII
MASRYAYVKAWRKSNKEKVAEYARRWRAAHPEIAKEIKERYRERSHEERLPREAAQKREKRAADPEGNRRRCEAFRERKRQRQAEIAGRPRPDICELCGQPGAIVFDHCHSRGAFRGWICDRCNKVLGLVKDDPLLLRRMAGYLEASSGETDGQAEKQAA